MNRDASPQSIQPQTSPFQDIGFFTTVENQNRATETAIEKLLEKIPARNRWCVEFGAADGIDSNARNLIVKHGYSAVLIEGSQSRFAQLKKNCEGRDNVFPLSRFVGFTEQDGLDTILAKFPIPADFDFLTVDIDGNDYHVWNAIVKYRPKIVMIEFNPTIPPELKFVQPADPSVSQGSSLASIVELGNSKGYELVAVLGVNAFFATKEIFPTFEVEDNRITALWTNRDCVTYIFCGYDGRIFLRGSGKLPWHSPVTLCKSKMQALPAIARGYPFTVKRRLLYALCRPFQMVKMLCSIKKIVDAHFGR
jgi:hypothetical protein